MSEQRASMMEPPIEDLLDKVDSKFTLVTLAAKRGREINLYYNQLGDGLGAIVPPQVTTTARKPLSIALEEIAAGKIVYVARSEEELAAEAAAAADALAAKKASAIAPSAAVAEAPAAEAEAPSSGGEDETA